MISFEAIVSDFLNRLEQHTSSNCILCGLLGGSVAQETFSPYSDIDILLICEDGKGKQLYNDILNRNKHNSQFKKFLDIKIIEKRDIKQINSSIDSPYFYHFVQSSKLLTGNDLKSLFKLEEIWCYQALHKYIEKIEQIKEIFYIYEQQSLAEVLLFEAAKRFTVIWELISNDSRKKTDIILKDIYKKDYQKIRKQTMNIRFWISLYGDKGSKRETGFNLIKLKKKRQKNHSTVIKNNEFEDLVRRIKLLGEKTLDLTQI